MDQENVNAHTCPDCELVEQGFSDGFGWARKCPYGEVKRAVQFIAQYAIAGDPWEKNEFWVPHRACDVLAYAAKCNLSPYLLHHKDELASVKPNEVLDAGRIFWKEAQGYVEALAAGGVGQAIEGDSYLLGFMRGAASAFFNSALPELYDDEDDD
jgi:hypothetical protein